MKDNPLVTNIEYILNSNNFIIYDNKNIKKLGLVIGREDFSKYISDVFNLKWEQVENFRFWNSSIKSPYKDINALIKDYNDDFIKYSSKRKKIIDSYNTYLSLYLSGMKDEVIRSRKYTAKELFFSVMDLLNEFTEQLIPLSTDDV